jgi:cytochrome c556
MNEAIDQCAPSPAQQTQQEQQQQQYHTTSSGCASCHQPFARHDDPVMYEGKVNPATLHK